MNLKKLMNNKRISDSRVKVQDGTSFEDNAIHDNSIEDLMSFLFNNLEEIDWDAAKTWFADGIKSEWGKNKEFKNAVCSFIIYNFTQSDKLNLIKESGLKYGFED